MDSWTQNRIRMGLILTIALATQQVQAVQFTDVTAASGITHSNILPGGFTMNGGAAAGDFNGDGRVDLFFTRHSGSDLLYLNNGDGTFTDTSAASGFTASITSSGASAADIDNDGDLDIYVTADSSNQNYLYLNNGSGQFTEVAAARGAHVPTPAGSPESRYGSAFGDYDRDGYLDLYTTAWAAFGTTPGATPSKLLRNMSGGQAGYFEDVTVTAGVAIEGGPAPHSHLTGSADYVWSFSPRFTDLDSDGNLDLAIVGDFGTSRLFWSNGDGTFTEGTVSAGVGTDGNGMGSAIGDYNNDGRLDWFVTAIHDPDELPTYDGNRLFLNNGDRTFTDTTTQAGVRDIGWGWGAAFFDADNDGDEDLVATNGFPSIFENDMTTLFLNNGDATFDNASPASGIDGTGIGLGLLTLDYDGDGDLDVLVINNNDTPVLYRNDADGSNDWLRIDLVGHESNSMGIGALITVDPDLSVVGDEMIREVNASSHFLAQSEIAAHFGLGSLDGTIDQIKIVWPTGKVAFLSDVAPNQRLTVSEVPEPTSSALLGLAGVLLLRRRRAALAR